MAVYQALYRKYRPQTFDEVVGQKSITETLKTQLVTNKLSHAYLFTGTRGTGKTSCAKILAKAVNCENPVDGNPCNCCGACRSIDNGSCMDVLEIDAASNNGVDNVRGLRDDAIYTPSEVKKRVYIIDEVHMLSMSAFNALLKIIEEPPEHLLFILATTELHKVPATILSRCQRFSFRRLLPEDIAGRINFAAYQEGIEIDDAAIRLLARLADGALRDGMSLLDQCASASRGMVTADSVYRCLGLAGERSTAQMLEAIARHDSKTVLSLFSKLYSEGKDLAAMLNELCTLTRDLLLLKTIGKAGAGMIAGTSTEEELNALLPLLSAGELMQVTSLLQQTTAGFSRSANRRIDAELCLMQLCNPSLSLDSEALNARLSRLEDQVASGVVLTAQAPAAPRRAADDFDDDRPPIPGDEEAPPAAMDEPAPQPQTSEHWPRIRDRLYQNLKRPVNGFFLANERAPVTGTIQGDLLTLTAADEMTFAMINNEQVKLAAAEAAAGAVGHRIRVEIRQRGKGQESSKAFQDFLNHTNENFSHITHINM